MKKILVLTVCVLAALSSKAQISIGTSNLTYIQDFNALGDTNTSTGLSLSAALPNWILSERGTPGNAQLDQLYKASDGASQTGNTYSYGTTGSTERALGSLASGNVRSTFGTTFVNNTNNQIDTIIFSYYAEQWRAGGDTSNVVDSLFFSYSTSVSTIDSNMTGFTVVPELFAIASATTPTGAKDGNSPAWRKLVSYALPVTLPDGGTLAIKWVDYNSAGSDDGIAIDDLVMTFIMQGGNPVTPPAPVSRIPADNATNVADGSTTLSLTFDKPITLGTGTITVAGNGVTPQTINVPSADVTVAGSTVNISGVNIICGKEYNVQYQGACFTSAGLPTADVSNTTAWNFSTVLCASIADLDYSLPVDVTTSNGNWYIKSATADAVYTVYNNLGMAVANGIANSNVQQISTSFLAPGVYIVRVEANGKFAVAKISVN